MTDPFYEALLQEEWTNTDRRGKAWRVRCWNRTATGSITIVLEIEDRLDWDGVEIGMRLREVRFLIAAGLWGASQLCAQTQSVPEANPARPTVATPATLTPVGYLQFESGVFYADGSPGISTQFSINQVTKLTVAPRLQFLGMFDPVANTQGADGGNGDGNQPGGIAAGVQAVVLPGDGARPTISLSYARTLYAGSAPDIDIGSFDQSATFLWSEDVGGFHFDVNGIFNQQSQAHVRRGQFGQTVSVSHQLGPFTVAGELWHFTQPLLRGNAVGNLWALSYAMRKNLVFDAGFNRGLTSSSTQWEGFGGFTYRLPYRLWREKAHDKLGRSPGQ
jgi:hypothetical protein